MDLTPRKVRVSASVLRLVMSTTMRSLLRARSALPIVARGVRKQLIPVFSVPVRTMSIPRPSWDKDLQDLDPEVYKIIQQEQGRQHKGIALIPSENYTTHAVSQVPFVPVCISVVQLLESLLSRTVSWDARYVVDVSTWLELRALAFIVLTVGVIVCRRWAR